MMKIYRRRTLVDFICEFYYMSRTEGPQVACEGTLPGAGKREGRAGEKGLDASPLLRSLRLSAALL